MNKIERLLEEIMEHQMNHVELAKTTIPYKLVEKALNELREYKAENLPISVVNSREIEKLNHDIELWKNLYHQRGRIMEKWIEKYNLPIAKAVLDTGSHES